jgi:hypothetical protein
VLQCFTMTPAEKETTELLTIPGLCSATATCFVASSIAEVVLAALHRQSPRGIESFGLNAAVMFVQ